MQAARDIEAVRLALDQGNLTYLGYSYGTMLGTAYAELFTQNIRAMVLDAAVDHSQSETDALAANAQSSEQLLAHFFARCDKYNDHDCFLRYQISGSFKTQAPLRFLQASCLRHWLHQRPR